MRAVLPLVALALAGCQTLPKTVEIPVPVPCIKPADIPARPPLVKDAELRAATRGERTFAMRRYQDLAEPYMAELEALAGRCSAQ